jgi:serine-type D-Ala-D-Ala carboxypeptidase (penicillin-binding protein 5/6)
MEAAIAICTSPGNGTRISFLINMSLKDDRPTSYPFKPDLDRHRNLTCSFMIRYLFISLILICVTFASGSAYSADINDPFPKAGASYLLQLNGRTLWSHKPDLRLPMASITKIMTALIVLENTKPEDIVTISQIATKETGTRLGLKAGERIYVKDLLSAVLIHSANDACHALADYVGGNESGFVELMNRHAKKLGLTNTHFQNSSGHDHEKHYSTASDIALLTIISLNNPTISKMVSTVSMKIKTVNGKRTFLLKNKNEIIGRYEGAQGVKTGFTSKAGKCLVAYTKRDKTDVLLVLLNSPNRWSIAVEMMDKAFAEASSKKNGL